MMTQCFPFLPLLVYSFDFLNIIIKVLENIAQGIVFIAKKRKNIEPQRKEAKDEESNCC